MSALAKQRAFDARVKDSTARSRAFHGWSSCAEDELIGTGSVSTTSQAALTAIRTLSVSGSIQSSDTIVLTRISSISASDGLITNQYVIEMLPIEATGQIETSQIAFLNKTYGTQPVIYYMWQ
jgi:hypothetical protein